MINRLTKALKDLLGAKTNYIAGEFAFDPQLARRMAHAERETAKLQEVVSTMRAIETATGKDVIAYLDDIQHRCKALGIPTEGRKLGALVSDLAKAEGGRAVCLKCGGDCQGRCYE